MKTYATIKIGIHSFLKNKNKPKLEIKNLGPFDRDPFTQTYSNHLNQPHKKYANIKSCI